MVCATAPLSAAAFGRIFIRSADPPRQWAVPALGCPPIALVLGRLGLLLGGGLGEGGEWGIGGTCGWCGWLWWRLMRRRCRRLRALRWRRRRRRRADLRDFERGDLAAGKAFLAVVVGFEVFEVVLFDPAPPKSVRLVHVVHEAHDCTPYLPLVEHRHASAVVEPPTAALTNKVGVFTGSSCRLAQERARLIRVAVLDGGGGALDL